VSTFADAADVYDRIGRVLEQIAADPQLDKLFRLADTCVRYELRNPDAQITVGSRSGAPVRVDCGPSQQKAEVVITMDVDVAYGFLLGEIDMTVALARGQVRADGPVSKMLAVLPAVEPLLPRYRALVSPPNGGGVTR
jgi:hypothetical protein